MTILRRHIHFLLIITAALPCLSPSQPKWIQQNIGTSGSLSDTAFQDSLTGRGYWVKVNAGGILYLYSN